jgi:DNA-binding response OmpR family regulator
MKILMVDDDDFLRDMYATKFKESGHEVRVAKNGERALEDLVQEEFDVVLVDVVMPGITGVELLQKIKDGKLGGSPKCIVLSNQGEESDITAATSAGADGYIVKADMIPSEVVAKVESIGS